MKTNIKYGIVGGSGRLGSEVKNVFSEAGFKLVFEYQLEDKKQEDDPQVLVDCSLPEVFDETISYVKQFNSPLVIATTGLSKEQIKKLKEISQTVPVVQSYNFSTGIQVLLKLTEIAKDKLKGWDIEIEETHHRYKKDKPSGTAKMIENLFPEQKVNISSLRLGNVAGDHTISFGGLGEILSIKHSATSRRTFAEGILKSAQFALSKKNGFYTFTDVVFGK